MLNKIHDIENDMNIRWTDRQIAAKAGQKHAHSEKLIACSDAKTTVYV